MYKIYWRRLLPCLTVLTVLLATGPVVADPQALRYYEDALGRFGSGDSEGALIQLKNSLQRDPSQLPARVLKGRVHLALGDPLQAEEELEMAGKLGADPALITLPLARARNQLGKFKLVSESLRPTEFPVSMQADLWAELGKARLGNKDRAGADIAFAAALELAPHHEQVLLSRARDLMQQKRYAEAIPLVEDALNRYPGNADAWFLMGSAYQVQGEFDSAVAHYRQALALDPRNQRAALGEALALLEGGKPEEAVGLLAKIRTEYPASLDAQYFYIQALNRLGRTEEADAILAHASDLVSAVNPADLGENTGQLLLAAIVTFQNQEYEAAYRFLTRYLELEPGDLRASKQLARLLVKMGQPAEASLLLTRLKVNHPNDPQLLVMLGDVKSNLHDYIAAERYYQSALELVQGNTALIGRLGLAQLQQGQMTAAINTFQRLLDRDPTTTAAASVFLGILYLSDSRLEEARAVADQIVALQPENLVALNLQAAVVISQGQPDDGRRMLQDILVKSPEFRPARFNLIRLDILQGRYDTARRALDELLAVEPDDPLALRESARLAAAEGERRTAAQRLERVRQLEPMGVRPILELIDLYVELDELDQAFGVAKTLNDKVAENLMAKKAIAEVLLQRGDAVEAQEFLRDAARLAGYNARELAEVARLQVQAGEREAGEWNLRKALAERPELIPARLDLATLLATRGEYEEAIVETASAIERDPGSFAAVALLGDIRLAQGQVEEAIALYRQASALSDEPELMVGLHTALVRAGRPGEALEELDAWHLANPDSTPVMRVLADHRLQIGDLAGARALYTRLAELEPENAEVHNNLANLLLPVDAELALVTALRAYELAPRDAAVLDTLGWMLVQLGELDRGLAHLREALVRNSRVPTIRYHLAVALEEYGNRSEARHELQRALAMKIPFPERQDAEQRLMRLGGGP